MRHDHAGDSGADHDHEAVRNAARTAQQALSQPSRPYVVLEHDRHAEIGGEQIAERDVAPADVRRVQRGSGLDVDRAGYDHAARDDIRPSELMGDRAHPLDNGAGPVGHRCGALDLPQHAAGGVEYGRLDTSAADVDGYYAKLWCVIHSEPPRTCDPYPAPAPWRCQPAMLAHWSARMIERVRWRGESGSSPLRSARATARRWALTRSAIGSMSAWTTSAPVAVISSTSPAGAGPNTHTAERSSTTLIGPCRNSIAG